MWQVSPQLVLPAGAMFGRSVKQGFSGDTVNIRPALLPHCMAALRQHQTPSAAEGDTDSLTWCKTVTQVPVILPTVPTQYCKT